MLSKTVRISLAAIAVAAIAFAAVIPSVSSATEIPDGAESLGEKWGYRIQFVYTGSDAIGVSWDFGDGSTSDEWNPVHTYPAVRNVTYVVKQIAWNHYGLTDEQVENGERNESVAYYTIKILGDPVVSFDSRGGSSVTSITAKFNKTIAAPLDPKLDGYSFSGWYKDAALKQKWDFSKDCVTKDTTLYAAWKVLPSNTSGNNGTDPVDENKKNEDTLEPAEWIQDHPAVVAAGSLSLLAIIAGAFTRNPRLFIIAIVLALVAAGLWYIPENIDLGVKL